MREYQSKYPDPETENAFLTKETQPGAYFGPKTARFMEVIGEYISDELRDAEYYRFLARKAGDTKTKKIIKRLAEEERRHAKQLGAAYFLSTGNQFMPKADIINDRKIPPFQIAARERFKAEYAAAVKYRQTAAETDDVCFRNLLEKTADDESRHALQLWSIIENNI